MKQPKQLHLIDSTNTAPNMRLETITPAMAKKYLEKNTRNRHLNEARVLQMARALKEGKWKLNGDAIRFDKNGNLVDGQHRLTACYLSGISLKTWVVRNLDEDVFDTIDQGKKRTASDILSVDGIAYGSRISAGARAIYDYLDGMPVKGGKQTANTLTNIEVAALVKNEIPELIDMGYSMFSDKRVKILLPAGPALAVYWLTTQIDEDKSQEFFDKLRTGENLKGDSPILVLRNRLMAHRGSEAKVPVRHLFSWTIKAWNAFYSGKPIRVLRHSSQEAFPRIKGLDAAPLAARIVKEPMQQKRVTRND